MIIFEDDSETSVILSQVLEKEGYIVKSFANVRNFFNDIITFEPDIVLLDLRIPPTSGETVCKIIKKEFNLPVILISAEYQLHNIALSCKANSFIEKPFKIKELLSEVNQIIQSTNSARRSLKEAG